MNEDTLKSAILNTLLYHSIFKYPLTLKEVHKYLIGAVASIDTVKSTILELPNITLSKNRYYVNGFDYDYKQEYTVKAWHAINKTFSVLKKLPLVNSYLQLLAISGSTAALAFKPGSDVDLFIISKPKKKWTARAITLINLRLKGLHVDLKNTEEENEGKLCANLFLDGSNLEIPHDKQDLYTAMEIAHLKVLVNKNNTFQHFLNKNKWIKKYLPNFYQLATREWQIDKFQQHLINKEIASQQDVIDKLFKTLQNVWFKSHIQTPTTLENTWIIDHRRAVLDKYEKLH